MQYEKAASGCDEVYLIGDLNINMADEDTQNRNWTHFLEVFDIKQMVKDATRVTAHSSTLLDHVYTNQPDMISECFVTAIALSDHYPVCFTRRMTTRVKKHQHDAIRYRSYTHFLEADFLDDLSKEIDKMLTR